ncbi:MAG: hypothetical protein JW786_10560 [Desulfobacterales bacterium]|nr:hypothetical protein [Desulfobacterales bacterium]
MPEINFKELKNYLKNLKKEQQNDTTKVAAPIFLIYGEDLLCKTAFDQILDILIPDSIRSLNYERIDGVNENIYEVIQRINTFSLLPGTKVIAILDSQIFYSKQDDGKLFEKAKEAYISGDIKKGAKYFISLLGLLNFTLDDVGKPNGKKKLKSDSDELKSEGWIDEITDYCVDQNLSVPTNEDDADVLQKAVIKGFPKTNHLIITTDIVDKRRGLFKTIKQYGIIIDCSVPKGDRQADKKVQEAVLYEKMETILLNNKKKMNKAAFRALYEMTGFDLRTFSNNLEKLINYIGDRQNISIDDIEAVLKRTKKDPIYELTHAITDRDIEKAFFFLESLLKEGIYPLQILAAISNQIRKLLVIKAFTESRQGIAWHVKISYDRFKNAVIPAIQKYDGALLKQLEDWEGMLLECGDADNRNTSGNASKQKIKVNTDLLIAKNPKNPYPIYQLLLKSEKFTKKDLLTAIEELSHTDFKLKSSGQNPKQILETAIFHICQP